MAQSAIYLGNLSNDNFLKADLSDEPLIELVYSKLFLWAAKDMSVHE